jgi:RNA polymerase sigma-70 factor (ECF subfamily)
VDLELERAIRAHCDAERFESAATAAVRGYGPQVYGFLLARLRVRDRADDVFAQLCEDLWRGIEGFRWSSSFFTWMYALARNAAHRYLRTPHNQPRRHTTAGKVADAMEAVRTETPPYLRTEVKDRFAALREQLSEDEQTLLVLRIESKMQWDDIARVMSDGDLDPLETKRASAALRQRFGALKHKLREMAEREGLLGRGDE